MRRERPSSVGCHARGQASVEFALLTAMLCAALLIPWAGGLSPAEWLLGAVVASARAFPQWLAIL